MTKEAFAEQVVLLRSTLYYVSYSMLTNRADQEDAVQECLHKAFARRESLRDERYVKRWLIRILVNECYNILRRRKREVPTDELYIVAPEDADLGVFESLNELEEKLRLPVVLHYMEGYTTREIAEILRVPEGTIKSRLKRARTLIGDIMRKEEAWA